MLGLCGPRACFPQRAILPVLPSRADLPTFFSLPASAGARRPYRWVNMWSKAHHAGVCVSIERRIDYEHSHKALLSSTSRPLESAFPEPPGFCDVLPACSGTAGGAGAAQRNGHATNEPLWRMRWESAGGTIDWGVQFWDAWGRVTVAFHDFRVTARCVRRMWTASCHEHTASTGGKLG